MTFLRVVGEHKGHWRGSSFTPGHTAAATSASVTALVTVTVDDAFTQAAVSGAHTTVSGVSIS
jgi:hypothetical protein